MQPKPIIIAHRGASGQRPEHTLAAYQLAIDQGADYIEPDLVMTKDGHLICRHENEISGTTDVATKPEFADRKKVQIIDGMKVEGWFTEDFTLAEIKTLRCKERLPQLRPANMAYDGLYFIPTFEEVVELAAAQSKIVGRLIGVYPETKHPSWFESLNLSFDEPLISLIKKYSMDDPRAPIFIQSFEVSNLKRLKTKTRVRLIQLMAREGGPFDGAGQGLTYAQMSLPEGLAAISAYASGVGPEKTMILPRNVGNEALAPTSFVQNAHKVGLQVHPWTFRAENYFLSNRDRRGNPAEVTYLMQQGDLVGEIQAFLALGVDGVFSDFPGIAFEARETL
ncbi:glycerophosphodiester phosphodiesterase [Candidatus Phycosocius spiralis]|nr:glycerophosphodiester phosphodiesterase [Candidatus Phycosocius spiralis]